METIVLLVSVSLEYQSPTTTALPGEAEEQRLDSKSERLL